MPGLVGFLRCFGRAAIKNSGRAIASLLPFGEAAFEIAKDACDEYRRTLGEDQLREELQGLVLASQADLLCAAQAATAQEAAAEPAEVRLALASYLNQLPATLPQRKEDPQVIIPGDQHSYTLRGLLAAGDVADVYLAQSDRTDPAKADCILKV